MSKLKQGHGQGTHLTWCDLGSGFGTQKREGNPSIQIKLRAAGRAQKQMLGSACNLGAKALLSFIRLNNVKCSSQRQGWRQCKEEAPPPLVGSQKTLTKVDGEARAIHLFSPE